MNWPASSLPRETRRSDGYIRGVNARTLSMFGYSKEEMLGMTVETLMPRRLRQHHIGQRKGFFANMASRPIDKSGDLIAISKDGREPSAA